MKVNFKLIALFGSLMLCNSKCFALSIITEDWPPVSFLNDQKEADGLAVELVNEIQKIIGTHDAIKVYPWARGYKIATTEPNVVLFAMAFTDERSKIFNMLGPIAQGEMAFFATKNSNIKIHSLEEAKKYQVGTYRATNFENFLKKNNFPKIELAVTPVDGARFLFKKRIELLVEDSIVIGEVLKQLGESGGEVKKLFVAEKTALYFGFSPGTSPEIINQWKNSLEQLKKNGKFTSIYKKWLPYNTPPLENHLLIPPVLPVK